MCGRYQLNATPAELSGHFGGLLPADVWRSLATFSSYNIAPSIDVPIIRYSKQREHNTVDRLAWGFRPQWASRAWINARSETLFQSSAFKDSAKARRCLVMASGWYEWRAIEGEQKQPFHFHFDSVFAFAGVWTARKVNDDWSLSFAIITTPAEGMAAHVHDRMPLVMHPQNYAAWLHPATQNPEVLMKPFSDGLKAHPVSTLVNDPRNGDVKCIEERPPEK